MFSLFLQWLGFNVVTVTLLLGEKTHWNKCYFSVVFLRFGLILKVFTWNDLIESSDVVESTKTVNSFEHESMNIVYFCNENSKSSQLLIVFYHAFFS